LEADPLLVLQKRIVGIVIGGCCFVFGCLRQGMNKFPNGSKSSPPLLSWSKQIIGFAKKKILVEIRTRQLFFMRTSKKLEAIQTEIGMPI